MANQQELEIILRGKNETGKAFDELNGQVKETDGGIKAAALSTEDFAAAFVGAAGAAAGFITAAVAAAKAVAALAAEAERISNKALISGFTTDAVQGLDRLAKNSQVSSEMVFRAIGKMQQAAVEGKDGFTNLGLSAAEFIRQAPTEQLAEVARKIMELPTATERAAAAMKLFGESGTDLIPVLAEVASGTTGAVVAMSGEQIAALKKVEGSLNNLSGAWTDFRAQVTAAAAGAGGTGLLDALSSQLSGLAALARDQGFMKMLGYLAQIATGNVAAMAQVAIAGAAAQTPTGPSLQLPGLNFPGVPALNPQASSGPFEMQGMLTPAQVAGIEMARKAAEKAAKERIRLAEATAKKEETIENLLANAKRKGWNDLMKEVENNQQQRTKGLLVVLDWEAKAEKKSADERKKAQDDLEKHLKEIEAARVKRLQDFAQSFSTISGIFADVREGLVAMGVEGDSALMKVTVALQTAASAASGFFSAMAKGDTLGMIGSAIGGVVGIASALGIGGNKVIMQVNDMRDAFFAAHGGWLQVQKDLSSLTNQDLVKKIFDAKTVEGFNAAVAEAMKLLDTQRQAQEDLQAAIEKYGFSIEELGPKFAQQELDKQAAQLWKEFQLLTAAGIDVNTVIGKMGPGLVEFVETAIKAGATIPEAMRPMIDQLIASGQLLDENGNAFASAEDAGISFAKTLTESMQDVIEEIRNLVAALTGIPAVKIPVTYDDQTGGGAHGGKGGAGAEGLARGGVILPFVPRGVPAAAQGIVSGRPGGSLVRVGEGGEAELVAPVRALFANAERIGAAAAGKTRMDIHIYLDGREITASVEKRVAAGLAPKIGRG